MLTNPFQPLVSARPLIFPEGIVLSFTKEVIAQDTLLRTHVRNVMAHIGL